MLLFGFRQPSSEKKAHLWAERFDRELTDVFEIQDEVTTKILGVLTAEMIAAEIARVRRGRPDSVTAWDAYLRSLPGKDRGKGEDD